MVQLIVKNDTLYMVKAGKEIKLESVTIIHNEKYEFTVFIIENNKIVRKNFKQLTFRKPLVTFTPHLSYNDPSHTNLYAQSPTKAWYINFYEKTENVKLY